MQHVTPYKPCILDREETLPLEELRAMQFVRLRDCLRRIANVPVYKRKFEEAGITPDSIKSVDDIVKLPFTTKSDLREAYPLGMLAVDRSEVVRFHGSSGTTGKPTMVAYTPNDLKLWANLCARFLVAGQLERHHTVQIAFGYGLFTGGFGLHYGCERVGAAVIPAASGNTKRQIMLLQDMKAEHLVCTPSYALTIGEAVKAEGLDPVKDIPLRFAQLGGEPWTDQMRITIEESLGVKAYNNYGLSEVIGPGVTGECHIQDGMHIQEDHFIFECVNPETLQPVPDGEKGEFVITSFSREAMPVIRYRTRDIGWIYKEPCTCGRTTRKMSRIVGRNDDMLIIRGVNVFPSQIEEALLTIKGVAPHYHIVVDRPKTLDEITVKVEVIPEFFSDKISEMTQLKEQIGHAITSVTGLGMNVELCPPQTLQRFEGKAKRVEDNRGILETG